MASHITIDLSNIGDKVVAAIHESMEKVVEAKVAAALAKKGEDEKPEPELDVAGMHRQILSNAKCLHRVLATGTNIHQQNTFDVITWGVGTTLSALVIFEGSRRVLLRGPDAPSEAKALQKLLTMTTEMMKTKSVSFELPANGWRSITGDGNSYYCTAQR
ncbi:hypothetical protein CB0940_03391 [Cercospora beticola]|uniref:Uncharacterized protein n=1 Tax=Cercospora beticola TaxID=122368 RepID=A0A2G5I561_CERBT|nr:hypothetical protein CB0940_03391 [Cercospora beticola]PIA99901.1 hypothetical protein CB0940_03391 [Cercospora beticola]WPB00566.1 hypothetical protein RHO25_005186 [Cercospora beticola]